MAKRASLIGELEKLLNDGGSDKELCDKAIEIVEWLVTEGKALQHIANIARAKVLDDQQDYFVQVIEQIRTRRHANALDAFKLHCKNKGYIS